MKYALFGNLSISKGSLPSVWLVSWQEGLPCCWASGTAGGFLDFAIFCCEKICVTIAGASVEKLHGVYSTRAKDRQTYIDSLRKMGVKDL